MCLHEMIRGFRRAPNDTFCSNVLYPAINSGALMVSVMTALR
jgi:hypothetical protein